MHGSLLELFISMRTTQILTAISIRVVHELIRQYGKTTNTVHSMS